MRYLQAWNQRKHYRQVLRLGKYDGRSLHFVFGPFLDPDDFNVVLVRVILIFGRLRALHPTLIFWQAQYEEMADGEEFSLVRTPGENPLGWLLGLPSGPGPPLDPGILTWIFAWRSGLLLPFTVWKRCGTPVLLFPGC